ncbi:unnamed protein product [Allacma fusca]|uniref:Uncharacterized protein n=1 Tax=Allacma fusca TaxID=39272 RepID=A0A8J2L8I3_9HEXA|nr:unnamed protein product [Allacma fusca]
MGEPSSQVDLRKGREEPGINLKTRRKTHETAERKAVDHGEVATELRYLWNSKKAWEFVNERSEFNLICMFKEKGLHSMEVDQEEDEILRQLEEEILEESSRALGGEKSDGSGECSGKGVKFLDGQNVENTMEQAKGPQDSKLQNFKKKSGSQHRKEKRTKAATNPHRIEHAEQTENRGNNIVSKPEEQNAAQGTSGSRNAAGNGKLRAKATAIGAKVGTERSVRLDMIPPKRPRKEATELEEDPLATGP